MSNCQKVDSRSVVAEVFLTIVTDIEALLNTCPLTHPSMDPNAPEHLTPSHFLIGRACPHLYLDAVHKDEVVSQRCKCKSTLFGEAITIKEKKYLIYVNLMCCLFAFGA